MTMTSIIERILQTSIENATNINYNENLNSSNGGNSSNNSSMNGTGTEEEDNTYFGNGE
jgi:hypothetical protein